MTLCMTLFTQYVFILHTVALCVMVDVRASKELVFVHKAPLSTMN